MSGNGDNTTAPSTPKAAGGGTAALSARENEILAKAIICLKSPPEIDYDKLATEVGMTNPRSASNAWGLIKKKMGWNVKVAGAPSSGKTTGSTKRKRAVAALNDADDDENITPTKQAKTTAKAKRAPKAAAPKKLKKSPAVAKDDSEDEEDKTNKSVKAEENSGPKKSAASFAAAFNKKASHVENDAKPVKDEEAEVEAV